MFIQNVTQALHQHGVIFAVVGGYAVALHGAVRGTIDLDLALQWNQKNIENAVAAIQSIGLVSRLPLNCKTVFEQRQELINKRNLIAWNFYNPDNLAEQIDLIIDFDLADKAITHIPLRDSFIPVLNKQDLIQMKEKAGRSQDLADVDALRKIL